ncbi:choice-of-anchor B family protein [Alteromonas facilis]|uniref:choice-of-anchor B family protein n=1 Tax=Alteromonas facilis TaxID=2048004 RepID=UPI000C295461|nr:choice-of-anchor B family protein [Alteromonas facilis]
MSRYAYVKSSIVLIMLGLSIASQGVNAHSEKEKARFVAQNGRDSGTCNNRFRPCASISYAVQQANKGDAILVSAGTYNITSEQELLYLVSDLQPVLGGYSTIDNYQVQQPEQFSTVLVGVPPQYVDALYQKGFDVIVDSKGITTEELDISLESVNQMLSSQSSSPCTDGQSAGFACDNISLLAHVPLSDLPTNSSSANDIWGHVDLNTMREYAIIGLRRGIAVVDVTSPENPEVIGSVVGQSTVWRDIKVYQYYSTSEQRWRAYAYAGADSVNEGLTIIDLNQLPDSVSLAARSNEDERAHNVYISNIDYTTNTALSGRTPLLHVTGSENFGGAWRSFSFKDPTLPTAEYAKVGAVRSSDYTHDASSLLITDERAQRDCVDAGTGPCNVILDFNEDNLILWDHSQSSSATELGRETYPNASYVHSGWWSEDKQYVILHDELDEQQRGLNTTVHFFDISDLNSPTLVASWVGPTRAIDHNGFVRGNRYYMSNYERGVTILDISDPTAPEQVGFFDTFGSSDNASFNGTWGVYPYLPSGIILASDIQGGLYILRDETIREETTRIGFNNTQVNANEGENLALTVDKVGNAAASVDYHVITGSAASSDIQASNGTLTWAMNDTNSKIIEIPVEQDSREEGDELFFVRLMNVSGADLSENNLAFATINGSAVIRGIVGFDKSEYIVKEIDGSINIDVFRNAGSDQAISVNYAIEGISATLDADVQGSNGALTWADGDTATKTISLALIDDSESENIEQLSITLSAEDSAILSDAITTVVSIRDDESNQAPTADASGDFQVNARQTVNLAATASDPEGEPLTISWQQNAGASVNLLDADTLTPRFSAPNSATSLTFELTVEDDFGVTTTDSITVTVNAVTSTVTTSNGSGGGSLNWLVLMLLSVLVTRRQQRVKV